MKSYKEIIRKNNSRTGPSAWSVAQEYDCFEVYVGTANWSDTKQFEVTLNTRSSAIATATDHWMTAVEVKELGYAYVVRKHCTQVIAWQENECSKLPQEIKIGLLYGSSKHRKIGS